VNVLQSLTLSLRFTSPLWNHNLSFDRTPLDRSLQSAKGWFYGLTLTLGMGVATPGLAAERLTVQLGPLQETVAIADLEQFANTGQVPSTLRLLTPLLTVDVKQALDSRLQLDPAVGEKLANDLLQTSAGARLLSALQLALPNSSPAQIQATLTQTTQQSGGISLLGFLRSYPEETITIDASSAIALASQMNLPYWHSQALSSILERELTVKGKPFQANFDPTGSGSEWVQQQTLTFHDFERDRTIPADLYWSNHTHGPLVVLSHGFGADRRFLGYLASHLASYGLTVAAIEHPGSNVTWLTQITTQSGSGTPSDILPATEFVDRPQDIRFLLNQLERLNQYSLIFRGKFNTQQVSVIGHSLGGSTALALVGARLNLTQLKKFCDARSFVGLSPADWLQCAAIDLPDGHPVDLHDSRVVQAIALNPVMGRLFDNASLAAIKVPTMILTGTDDAIAPAVSQQLLPFTQLKTSKYLLTAIGSTHLSVGDPANLNQAFTQSLFLRERQGSETEPLRQLLRGVSLAFVKQLTPEAKRYAPFLTSAYAQSFSTQDLQLRLNSQLPANLSSWLTMAALPLEQFVSSALLQQNRQRDQKTCDSRLECVFKQLPLVMFILPGRLPGSLPSLGEQVFWRDRCNRRNHR
jgi:predicted dienelactone hydrolase